MEITEPPQCKVGGLRSAECTYDFQVRPRHAVHSRASSVLIMLIRLLRDAVKHFLNPYVLHFFNVGRLTA